MIIRATSFVVDLVRRIISIDVYKPFSTADIVLPLLPSLEVMLQISKMAVAIVYIPVIILLLSFVVDLVNSIIFIQVYKPFSTADIMLVVPALE